MGMLHHQDKIRFWKNISAPKQDHRFVERIWGDCYWKNIIKEISWNWHILSHRSCQCQLKTCWRHMCRCQAKKHGSRLACTARCRCHRHRLGWLSSKMWMWKAWFWLVRTTIYVHGCEGLTQLTCGEWWCKGTEGLGSEYKMEEKVGLITWRQVGGHQHWE